MADGDRPIVLVPLATARKAARRAGVTLNLSAEDIQLAGKWKHGWIPLDAVASAVKAKRYHGGGGEGHTVKGKGRAGSAVESRREPSRGRTKGALPTRGRTFSDAGDTTVSRREHGLPTGGRKAAKANPVGSKLEHSEPRYVTPGVAKAPEGPRRERAAKSVLPAAGKPSLERVSAKDLRPGDVLESWRGGGKSDVGSAMGGRRVVGVEHNRGFANVKFDDGFGMRLRHEDGTADRVAPERGAATARAQQVAQDRTRRVEAARGEPKLAELSEADLQSLISRYGEKSVQADAARAEMLRRGAPGRGASKRSKPLNLPSGYEVRPDRVHVAPGVTQLGSTFSAYGPDGRRVHHAARSESEAALMARKHHERATETERRHQEAAAARSAAAQVKQGEQAAWDARMAAGTARHKVTTDAIAERRKAEPILLRIRAGMLSKDALTALADDPSAGRYERVAAHRALTALASRRLATATPAQLDQIESVAASAKGLAPSERDAFLRASAARRRKLKRGGR